MLKALEIGNFSFEYDSGDLFRLKWRGDEVIQRAYVALRDENWNTIPAAISDLDIQHGKDSLIITFLAKHTFENIDFSWRGEIYANIFDELHLKMNGTVNGEFNYCKIGINIHHGLSAYRDLKFTAKTLAGDYSSSFGPDLVPQLVHERVLTAMTPHYEKLHVEFPKFNAEFSFLGDRFEMQDHRNWSDANWKSYGTPLENGFPFQAHAGQEIYQEVRLLIAPSSSIALDGSPNQPQISPKTQLPAIGYRMLELATRAQVDQLKRLRPDHLRIEILSSKPDWIFLSRAVDIAREVGARLEIALFLVPELSSQELDQLLAPIVKQRSNIVRILVLTETGGYSPFLSATDPSVAEAVKRLVPAEITVFSGTDQFFSDINRAFPDYSKIDGMVFALNPQVHACDDLSVMQNASTIQDIATYIRTTYPRSKIALSPVDLIGIGGPFPGGPASRNGFAPNEDARQQGLFCAAWTTAMIAHASQAGVDSLTLYEIAGNRGLMDRNGNLFPIFNILEKIANLIDSNYELIGVQGSSDEDCMALKFTQGSSNIYVAANLSALKLSVTFWDDFSIELEPYEVVSSDFR